MLLEDKITIDGDQRRKARGAHLCQQLTVAETCPALIAGGGHLDAREGVTKTTRHALVEQDLH